MSRMSNIESQAQEFRIERPVSISYYTIGISAALADLATIILSCFLVDLCYQNLFVEGGAASSLELEVGVVVAVLFVLASKIFNLYKLTALLEPAKHFSKSLLAWAISILLVTAILFMLRAGTVFSRGSTTIFAVLTFFPLVFLRLFFARALKFLIAQGALSGRRVVIIGEELELMRLSASSLLINFGLTELARISFEGDAKSDVLTQGELVKLNNAVAVARKQNAEELVIAFDWSRTALIEGIAGRLRISPLPVRLLPDRVVRSVFGRANYSTNGLVPSVELQRAPLTQAERLAKRACDTALAATAVILLAPLMLLTALAVKLDSAGPIIFRQRRTGFDGRTFFIYKFRTMSVMEDGARIAQTKRNDPRVTRVGRLLRQSSIDELPQLFNVIKGDMSLVGPRPHAVAHDDQYGAMISKYAYRHHVKPGITGWAQVNGQRGETQRIEDMEQRIELDLWYINNWSLLLDLRIMWRTCFELVRHQAY